MLTRPSRGWLALLAILVLCVGVELALWLSEIFGVTRLRQTAYENGGFWPGLLAGWRPNYDSQPYLMFFSYSFLHGGPGHLVVNMITLWSLGQGVIDRVGGRGFVLLYGLSILGGALGYAALAQTAQPMVGASGALFGLAGGLLAWAYIDRFSAAQTLWPVLRVMLFLIALNLAMYWALDGLLAWQTHLGGFLVGWVAALLIDPRPALD
ncbi:MAG: rhomboid family intramembrane serine protease [Pseudomonadota bacterium]